MPIAFTQQTIIQSLLDASNTTVLLNELHASLSAAGWNSVGVTGGYLYTITSPQLLVSKVRVWIDPTNSLTDDYVTVRVESADGERLGLNHWLSVGAGRELQIVAGICQFFISRPGSSEDEHDDRHNMVCGGILRVPEGDCDGEGDAEITTEAWWSNGDRYPNAGHGFFRNLRNHRYCFHSSSACRNGVMGSPSELDWFPRLFVPTSPVDVDYWEGYLAPRVRWHDGSPLYFDPLFGWGNASKPARLIGSLWDSMVVSDDRPLDEEESIGGYNWINFSHSDDHSQGRGTYFSSLYLLRGFPVEAALGNVAY